MFTVFAPKTSKIAKNWKFPHQIPANEGSGYLNFPNIHLLTPIHENGIQFSEILALVFVAENWKISWILCFFLSKDFQHLAHLVNAWMEVTSMKWVTTKCWNSCHKLKIFYILTMEMDSSLKSIRDVHKILYVTISVFDSFTLCALLV